MREFFENLQLNFYLPKLNVVQYFLDSVDKTKSQMNSASSPEILEGLAKFSQKCIIAFIFIFTSFSRRKLKTINFTRRAGMDGCYS